jgi:3-dehydroquinate synthase
VVNEPLRTASPDVPPLIVTHALGSYPVIVDTGALLTLPQLVKELLPDRSIVLISDDQVDRYYDDWTRGSAEARRLGARSSDAGIRLRCKARLTFPAGEASKTRDTWASLSDQMLVAGIGRDSAVVALGGGVVGDLAGFVAATYLRGIPYLQVPTSLLAMLDASVGGKVGVDTPHGKNLIGAFHPPVGVVADPLTLMSLPEREYRNGLAEAVKHGLIADREYFEWIEQRARALASRNLSMLIHLIRRSVEIKAAVVSEDEREGGRRLTLNAGHTVAHGLERASNFRLPHGEAVSLGLVVECRIAERLGVAPPGLSQRVSALLATLGLPVRTTEASPLSAVLDAMGSDKKNRGGELRFALPSGIGAMHRDSGGWTLAVEPAIVEEVLAAIS